MTRSESSSDESTDSFLREITEARERADAEVEHSSQHYVRDLEARFGDDVELKERLSKFARDNKLDEALVALWEEIQYYPARSLREDFSKRNKLAVSELAESKVNDIDSVDFTFQGHHFRISRREWWGMEDQHADFALFEDEAEVFAIGCTVDHGEFSNGYHCHSIEAFKKQGEWGKVLLGFYAKIQIERNKGFADLRYFRPEQIKQRFSE